MTDTPDNRQPTTTPSRPFWRVPLINALVVGVIGGTVGHVYRNALPWLAGSLAVGLAAGALVEGVTGLAKRSGWLARRRLVLLVVAEILLFAVVGIPYIITAPNIRPHHYTLCCATPADFGADYRAVTFTGGDDLTLAGWYIPSQNGAAVILLHGSGGDRRGVLFQAEALHRAGYGVLMYDQRALGESEGEKRSYGLKDVRDVPGAVEFLLGCEEVDPHRIGILGLSLGGQIALRAAAADTRLAAVAADGPAIVRYEDLPPPPDLRRRLQYPWVWLNDRAIAIMAWEPLPPPLVDVIGDIEPRPVLLMCGQKEPDEVAQTRRYYEHAGPSAELWEVPGAYHTGGPAACPEEYAARLVAFFDAALLDE
jgi:pimeloyl-ACP methyl ester carboxylesterase